jgi:hypothetical protein
VTEKWPLVRFGVFRTSDTPTPYTADPAAGTKLRPALGPGIKRKPPGRIAASGRGGTKLAVFLYELIAEHFARLACFAWALRQAWVEAKAAAREP